MRRVVSSSLLRGVNILPRSVSLRSNILQVASVPFVTRRSSSSNIVKDEYAYVSSPKFATVGTPMDCYRVMDQAGNIVEGAKDPEVHKYYYSHAI